MGFELILAIVVTAFSLFKVIPLIAKDYEKPVRPPTRIGYSQDEARRGQLKIAFQPVVCSVTCQRCLREMTERHSATYGGEYVYNYTTHLNQLLDHAVKDGWRTMTVKGTTCWFCSECVQDIDHFASDKIA